MKWSQKLLKAAAERLDLPTDAAAGEPRLELIGFSRFLVERHRGILEYTREAVTVALPEGRVRVTGSGLSITMMNRACLILRGSIEGVQMIQGGGHD